MSVPLRVLGDRVLVKPDVLDHAPQQLESGVIVAESMAAAVTGSDPTLSVHRGTVVAVGNPRHPKKEYAETLAAALEQFSRMDVVWQASEECHLIDAAALLKALTQREPCCAVDDDVLFAHDAGQQITVDGETYVMLREDDLLAVVEN